MNCNEYASIDQFRHVIKSLKLRHSYEGRDENDEPIYNKNKILPKVKFTGTVKLHGTNAAICVKDREVWFQSRTNIITPLKDNAGFAGFFSSSERLEGIREMDAKFRRSHLQLIKDDVTVIYYGEWIGKGIQKGVAVNELDKSFVLFEIKVLSENPYSLVPKALNSKVKNEDIFIYNIYDYKTWDIEVDLNDPLSSYEQIQKWVEEVEKECPFAKEFGISGVGEGIVFTHIDKDFFRFKAKGEKHSVTGKSKNPICPEKLKNVEEFVNYTVTENRLEQGIERVFTSKGESPYIEATGDFLRWLVGDIVKEEIDTLNESSLTVKDVSSAISSKGRVWFINYINRDL